MTIFCAASSRSSAGNTFNPAPVRTGVESFPLAASLTNFSPGSPKAVAAAAKFLQSNGVKVDGAPLTELDVDASDLDGKVLQVGTLSGVTVGKIPESSGWLPIPDVSRRYGLA